MSSIVMSPVRAQPRWPASRSRPGISVGEPAIRNPAASSAATFEAAVPAPPEMIAPAWPIRLPSGAVRPAMKATFGPAEAAMIPKLVPKRQLMSANGIFTLTLNAAFAVGFTLLGPLIVKIAGAPALIAVVAVLYFVAAVFCWTLPAAPPPPSEAGPQSTRGRVREAESAMGEVVVQLREGIGFIRGHREVRWSLGYLAIAASLV